MSGSGDRKFMEGALQAPRPGHASDRPIKQEVPSGPSRPALVWDGTPPPTSQLPLDAHERWAAELEEFDMLLEGLTTRLSEGELVSRTAAFIKEHSEHAVWIQVKLKQKALYADIPFQSRLMVFYALYEFLKLFQEESRRQVERQWYQTIDDVIQACVRSTRSSDDGRKRLNKTLTRWAQLGMYPMKIPEWKKLVAGEAKPKRGPGKLPKTEAERIDEMREAQAQQFPPPPSSRLHDRVDRTTCPYLFEPRDLGSRQAKKQHWRFTSIAFIDVLTQCLGLDRDVALTASIFFHRVFERGIYAKERFKFAAACVFLSAKASSKRMKLLHMVHMMHEILERPLLAGDEDVLEMERLHLLFYEIEVLQGIKYELTTELPFLHLRQVLNEMPENFRNAIADRADRVLNAFFWLPQCLHVPAPFLAEAAAYIACRKKNRVFSFSWCRRLRDGNVLTERKAKDMLAAYDELDRWKLEQQRRFDALKESQSGDEGFNQQRGGLRIDVTTIEVEEEYTKEEKTVVKKEAASKPRRSYSRRDAEKRGRERESSRDRSYRSRRRRSRSESPRRRSSRRRRSRSRSRGRSYSSSSCSTCSESRRPSYRTSRRERKRSRRER